MTCNMNNLLNCNKTLIKFLLCFGMKCSILIIDADNDFLGRVYVYEHLKFHTSDSHSGTHGLFQIGN